MSEEQKCSWEVLMVAGIWVPCGAHNENGKWHYFGGSTWMSTRELNRAKRRGLSRSHKGEGTKE